MGWTQPLDEGAERRLARLADLGERAITVILFSALALRIAPAVGGAPWDLAILIPEGLATLFMILRRRPTNVSTRPLDWLVALVGVQTPLLVAPGGTSLVLPGFGVGVLLTGVFLSVWGKLTLRRSFGLAAAHRGLVQGGPYTLLRHPIYAGYVVSYVAFWLLNPTAYNLAVYVLAIGMILARIAAEERLLSADPLYTAFIHKVRWRLAPGLY